MPAALRGQEQPLSAHQLLQHEAPEPCDIRRHLTWCWSEDVDRSPQEQQVQVQAHQQWPLHLQGVPAGDQSPSLPVEPTHPGQGGTKSLPVLQSPVLSDANNSPVVFKRKKRCKERKLEEEEEEREEKEEKEYIGLTKTKCGQHSLGDDCYQGLQWCYLEFFLMILLSTFLHDGFFLTSNSNRHECWPPVASDLFTYNLRNQNFKLWYKNFLILVCDSCPSWDESLWPRSHKQLATPRVENCQEWVPGKRRVLCPGEKKNAVKTKQKMPSLPTQPTTFPDSEDTYDLRTGKDNKSPWF